MLQTDVGMQKLNAGRVRSMDLITTAFFELLGTRPFARIRIIDICEKAGVARKTFYRNFPSKTAVVERLVDQVFFEFMQKLDIKSSGSRKIYLYWYEYILCTPEFALVFFDPDLYEFIVGKIKKFVEIEVNAVAGAAAFDPALAEYYLNFAASGIAAIMREWMKKGCKTPAKTMAVLTANLLSGLIIM